MCWTTSAPACGSVHRITTAVVDWPAEPVVARAYIEQWARGEPMTSSFVEDLTTALDRSATRLEDGARDGDPTGRAGGSLGCRQW